MNPFKFPPYAFSSITNELVHIDSVPNGLKCNCFCKECGGKLIARNRGEVNIHHFAHDGN